MRGVELVKLWATCCRPRVRGLARLDSRSSEPALRTQGSRTRPGYTLSPASTRARASGFTGLGETPRLPRARGLALGYTLSPASTRARAAGFTELGTRVAYPGLADSPWATRCRPRVRGLAGLDSRSSEPALRTQGSRTRPGLHAVAREYAGSCVWIQGLGETLRLPRARGLALGYTLPPASTRAREAGFTGLGETPRLPRVRGLALGYTLPPASTRALWLDSRSSEPALRTQGSRTRPGLHAVAREYAGSASTRPRAPALYADRLQMTLPLPRRDG